MEIAAISGGLTSLALLACPIGMGVMMWMMARGNKKESPARNTTEVPTGRPASIEVLREEQRRLGDEIDRLEAAPSEDRDAGAKSS